MKFGRTEENGRACAHLVGVQTGFRPVCGSQSHLSEKDGLYLVTGSSRKQPHTSLQGCLYPRTFTSTLATGWEWCWGMKRKIKDRGHLIRTTDISALFTEKYGDWVHFLHLRSQWGRGKQKEQLLFTDFHTHHVSYCRDKLRLGKSK